MSSDYRVSLFFRTLQCGNGVMRRQFRADCWRGGSATPMARRLPQRSYDRSRIALAGALRPAECRPFSAKSLSMRINHAVPLKYGRRRAATLLDVVSLLDRDLVGREANAKLPGFARAEHEKRSKRTSD